MNFPVKELKDWFADHGRDLPWRKSPTPYLVWISEVMLQQTQSAVVIPYLARWMDAFPTIQALSDASSEKVIKLWEGLGYYSRARNLHLAAKTIAQELGGELPTDKASLLQIQGIGPYTAGAILSFAFHQKAAAVDGNTIRVLARFFGIQEPVDKPATIKKIWALAEEILPDDEPWTLTEGLIELGALVCKKVPACSTCPLRSHCIAYRQNQVKELPRKEKRIQTQNLYRYVGVIIHEGHYMLRKGEKGKVMSDLYEFPFIEADGRSVLEKEDLAKGFEEIAGIPLVYETALPTESHSFTRFQAKLMPHQFRAKTRGEGIWKARSELHELPFSSGHRRILQKVLLP